MKEGPTAASPGAAARVYTSGREAIWLPRVLSAAVLVSGLLVALRVDTYDDLPFSRGLLLLVIAFGLGLAIWILRGGAEVRLRIRFEGSLVLFEAGNSSTGVALGSLDRFEFEGPLGASKRLFPAAVLLDRDGKSWRIPVSLDHGAELIHEIVRRAERNDLEAWADSLRLVLWMERGRWFVRAGYAIAASSLAVATWFHVH